MARFSLAFALKHQPKGQKAKRVLALPPFATPSGFPKSVAEDFGLCKYQPPEPSQGAGEQAAALVQPRWGDGKFPWAVPSTESGRFFLDG